eukprot:GHVP01062896.1.p2 GENE.GHVP01062896.1~~GHVP01062896.1.p2  ORF type:complete len:338 (+),score=90.35 GHVP01062896.1:1329-2342(+)
MAIFGKLLNKFKKDSTDEKSSQKVKGMSMSVEVHSAKEEKNSEAESDGADSDPGNLGKKTAKIAKRKSINHVEFEGISLSHPKSESMKEDELKPAKKAAPGFQNAAEAAELRKVLGLKRTKTAVTEIQFEGTGKLSEEVGESSGFQRSVSSLTPVSPSKSRTRSLGPNYETTPPANTSTASRTPTAMPKPTLKPPGSLNAKAKEDASKTSTEKKSASGNSTIPAYMQNRTLKSPGSSVGQTDTGKPEKKENEKNVPEFMKTKTLKPPGSSLGKSESGKPQQKEKEVPEFMRSKTLKPAGSTVGKKTPLQSQASQESKIDENNLPAFKDRIKMFQEIA